MNTPPLIPLEQLETFAHGLDHAEGICFAPNGLLYVGGEAGQLYRIDSHGDMEEIASTGGFMLGLAADAESFIYAIDVGNKVVWRFSPDGKHREEFTQGSTDQSLYVPNWGAFDSRGNYYLTDSGDWDKANGFIWIVRPGGQTEIWTDESVNFPNGCAVSPDESRLYVAETMPSAIVEIAINDDGSAGRRRVLFEMGLSCPDGVAIAENGVLVVSCYRPDTIYVWDAKSGLRVLAEDPRGTILAAPTNVVFTGDESDTIVVPNLGRWHLTRFQTPLRGVSPFYPTPEKLGMSK